MIFNFTWYCGKSKKKRKQYPKYQHEYYLNVTKPKRQKERQIKMNEEQKRVEELDDAFDEGMIFAFHLVTEKIETITIELKDKGFEPKGFSVLTGYIEDMLKEVDGIADTLILESKSKQEEEE